VSVLTPVVPLAGLADVCVVLVPAVNVYLSLTVAVPSLMFTYQWYMVPNCNPDTEQLLVPFPSFEPCCVPMLGTVSMVQVMVSLSGSFRSISSALVVVVHTLVLVFAGLGLVCVGSVFDSVVN